MYIFQDRVYEWQVKQVDSSDSILTENGSAAGARRAHAVRAHVPRVHAALEHVALGAPKRAVAAEQPRRHPAAIARRAHTRSRVQFARGVMPRLAARWQQHASCQRRECHSTHNGGELHKAGVRGRKRGEWSLGGAAVPGGSLSIAMMIPIKAVPPTARSGRRTKTYCATK